MLFLADSDLHLLISVSYIKKIKSADYIIIWTGSEKSFVYNYLKNNNNIIFFNKQNINFFNVEKINSWFEKRFHDIKFNSIATFYDTDHVFEFLKFKLKIPWNKVFLVDDGIASTYKVSMPKLYRRLPKAIYNLFLGRFQVNLSYYSLGSNKKIKNFITIFPDFLHFYNKDSTIIDVLQDYKKILSELSSNYFKKYKFNSFSGSIITLSPVLKYKRQTPQYVHKYLKNLTSYCDKSKPIYIKPHPRDDKETLIKIINKLEISINIIESQVPLELFFDKIDNSIFIGMPSTSFCIRSILYPNSDDSIIIIKERNDPFPERISVLENIFKAHRINYKIL